MREVLYDLLDTILESVCAQCVCRTPSISLTGSQTWILEAGVNVLKISPNFIPLSARDIIGSSLDPPLSPGQNNNCAKSRMHSLIVGRQPFHTPIDLLGELKERLHAALLAILMQRSIDGA
ncbi:hypothetical protein CEXT_136601 [Caerostris extrusa]|uniref:Uncharacterized protein n=1 Tax=Caerostris extrusa TaxID=172846 RepID=A0AAV4X9R0_CAEEX|nr:hypothetical protein CEXT_136601 [Caerostris extrusa]